MQLHLIRGGTKEEFARNPWNPGVGISLGNKWFTVENIVSLVKWSLEHTKQYVVVYVADSIHAINLEVRNRISYDRALKKALGSGADLLSKVRTEIDTTFSEKDRSRIYYARWSDIQDKSYIDKRDYLYSLYEKDSDFRSAIHGIIEGYTTKETRKFSPEEVHRLGAYLIEEIPELMNRVNMNGKRIDAYAYPHDAEIAVLVEKIQQGRLFPQIKERILDTEPKVFLEVR